MKGSAVTAVARLLWILPAILFALSIHQMMVAYDIRETLLTGIPATAEVVEFDLTDRSEATHAFVSLRVHLDDGRIIEKNEMSVPYSLVNFVRDRSEVDVLVRPGAAQEIVFRESGSSHWRIAAVNAAMSFVGFVMFFAGVFWWNRYLSRSGDPAHQNLPTSAG